MMLRNEALKLVELLVFHQALQEQEGLESEEHL